jgi:Ca2+-dependent lipid-binding protein
VGLPSGMCNKGVGAIEGACPWCKIAGMRMHGTCKYVGAITHTPRNSPLRKAFRDAHKKSKLQEMQVMHEKTAAPQRTIQEALASGQRMKRKKKSDASQAEVKQMQKVEPFTDVDAWSTRFYRDGLWNKLEQTVVDPAHEIMNLVKDILHLISSAPDTSMTFTKKRKLEENSNGRFLGQEVRTLVLWLFSYVLSKFDYVLSKFDYVLST